MVFCGCECARRIRVAVWGLKGGVFRTAQARELFGRYGVPNAMARRRAGQGRKAQGARQGVGQCQNAKDPRKAGLV